MGSVVTGLLWHLSWFACFGAFLLSKLGARTPHCLLFSAEGLSEDVVTTLLAIRPGAGVFASRSHEEMQALEQQTQLHITPTESLELVQMIFMPKTNDLSEQCSPGTDACLSQVRCLLRVSVFHLSYLRGIFPESYYREVAMNGLDGMVIKVSTGCFCRKAVSHTWESSRLSLAWSRSCCPRRPLMQRGSSSG